MICSELKKPTYPQLDRLAFCLLVNDAYASIFSFQNTNCELFHL